MARDVSSLPSSVSSLLVFSSSSEVVCARNPPHCRLTLPNPSLFIKIRFATVLLLPSEDGNHLNRGQNQTSGGDEQDNNNHSNAGVRNTTVLSIYLAFLFISLVPVVTDAVLPSQDASYHKWALALFHGVHTIFINPIVTVLILVSFVAQRDEILRHPPGAPSSSFSLVGLAVQAAVFALLALTWMWRLVLPWNESFDGHPVASLAWAWYQLVGFVAVDHVAFALVQAALLVVARSNPWLGFTNSETQPLLAGRN